MGQELVVAHQPRSFPEEPRCFAGHAVRGEGEPELVVVNRHASELGPATLELVEKDAHGLVGFVHPNIAPVLATLRLKGDVAVISEWVDGATLAELRELAVKIPVEIGLRVMLDVIGGLSAMHTSASLSFGAVTPEDVLVGIDGVSRITRFWLGRAAPILMSSRRAIHAAPELLRGDKVTPEADVFSIGVLLWEALAGRNLFEPEAAEEHLLRLEWDEIPRVQNVESEVADAVGRALRLDRGARTASLEKLAGEIARAAPSIAPRDAVAAWMTDVAGERVRARRALHDASRKLSGTPPPPDVTVPPPPVETTVMPPVEPTPEPTPAAVEPVPVEKPALPVEQSPTPAAVQQVAPAPKPAPSTPRVAPRPARQWQPMLARAKAPDPKPVDPPPVEVAPVVATVPPIEELDETEALSLPPSAPIHELNFEDDAPKPREEEAESDDTIEVSVSMPPPANEPSVADVGEHSDIEEPPKQRSSAWLASVFAGVCIFVLGFATGRVWPLVVAPTPAVGPPRASVSSAPTPSASVSSTPGTAPPPASASTESNESEGGTTLGVPSPGSAHAPAITRPRDAAARDATYHPSEI